MRERAAGYSPGLPVRSFLISSGGLAMVCAGYGLQSALAARAITTIASKLTRSPARGQRTIRW
jgi:hypothetical protein